MAQQRQVSTFETDIVNEVGTEMKEKQLEEKIKKLDQRLENVLNKYIDFEQKYGAEDYRTVMMRSILEVSVVMKDMIDTLNRETFEFITKKDYLEDAKKGILKAVEVGLYPVKINMVIMKDINQNEIDDMFEFCKDNDIVLQLIELIESENCDDDKFSVDYHYKLDDIEKELADIADDVREREFMQGRKKYYIDGGEIEVVKPVDNAKFCAKCSRLRITPDGKIKPCLLRNDNLVELISHVRNGASEEELEEIFIKGINKREPFNS